MRALYCFISSCCFALCLPGLVAAQEMSMPETVPPPILFNGVMFSIAPPPGPVLFLTRQGSWPSLDSAITGEIFLGATTPADTSRLSSTILLPVFDRDNDGKIPATTFDKGDHVLMKYALMIDADPDDLKDPSLYHFINQWYGVHYKWGGNSSKGIDCSALSQKTYDSVYRVAIRRTSKQQYRHSQRFKKYTEADEGDLVFFRINRVRISHVGIYLANGYFVHATRSRGVIISNLTEKYWKRRYAGCGRIVHEVRGDMESAMID